MSTVRDQEVCDVANELKQALLELDCFGRMHPAEDLTPEKAKALADVGLLSPSLAAYLGKRQVFHGFHYRPIREDIPVLEVTIPRGCMAIRVVGFRDGHVLVTTSDQSMAWFLCKYGLDKRPEPDLVE